MSARKRYGRWHVRIQAGGQRIERSLGSSASKADAAEFEAKLRRDLVAGKLGKAPARSIEDAILRWLEGARTLKSYENLVSKVRLMRPHLQGKSLSRIVDAAEAVKRSGQRDKLTPATINRRLAILRHIAHLAYDVWGWLDQPLGRRIKLLPGEARRDVYLTPDQVELLATCCEHPKVGLAIRLAARTGLREGELLKASAIFDGCIVVETSKNGRPRLVPIPPDLEFELPLGVRYATLRTFFEKAREKAGMPHVRFHDLRHTAASWWLMSGASMAMVRDLLGHSSLAMTSRYTHVLTADLKRVAENVAKIKERA